MLPRRITQIVAGAVLLISLAGCLETEPGTITVQNDSDQTIILQNVTDSGAKVFKSTVQPKTTQKSLESPSKGLCYNRWEIVDATGKVLRQIAKICEGETVTYP